MAGMAGEKVTLQILNTEKEVLFAGVAGVATGWGNWDTVEVNFELTETTDIMLRIVVEIQDGGWGSVDELYLSKTGETDARHATVVEKVEDEEGNESFLLTNEKVEGVEISGTTELLESAKFEAEILTEESETFTTVIEQVKETGTVEVKEDTKVAVVTVDLWAADGAEIHENFGIVTVTIDMPEALMGATAVEVFRVEDGELFACDAEIVDGKIVFTTDHFSTFLVKEKTVQNGINNGGNTNNGFVNIIIPVEGTKAQNTVNSFGTSISESVEIHEEIKEVVVDETVAKEIENAEVEEKNEVSSEITILEEEVPLAVNAGGDISMWPVFVTCVIILAFVGLYVFAKQRKMIK